MNEKNISYCESKSLKPFDWYAFLTRKKKENYTHSCVEYAFELSRDWICCASGNQCVLIPRESSGQPLDDKLANLGWYFAENIEGMLNTFKGLSVKKDNDEVNITFEDYQKRALETLKKIEKKSEQLLKKIYERGTSKKSRKSH